MPDNNPDPVASTQQFQAFVDRPEPEVTGARTMRVALTGVALVGLVIVLTLAWTVLGG